MQNVFDELNWRGLVEQITDKELVRILADDKITCYCGFDPSASSLQVGNLLAIKVLSHFQKYGHSPIVLIGGATGLIGDPSGRSKERNLLSEEEVAYNAKKFKEQMERFLDFEKGPNSAKVMNNTEWLKNYNFIDFLRDVGKYFRVGDMLSKESVRSRMEREEGISYTEFSYMLMQAYDFLHLYDNENCRLQIGGSDQWGNITAGIELIRRLRGKPAYGLTTPLVTNASGQKLGKTEEGTIWLDPGKTSPFKFYQFWIRTEDKDVIRYLKLFTGLSKEEIDCLEDKLKEKPDMREAQKVLAYELTCFVHGKEQAERAIQASEVLYGGEIRGFSGEELEDIFSDVPYLRIKFELLNKGLKLIDILVESGLCESRNAARTLIKQGGAYINNVREYSTERLVEKNDLISGRILLLRSGKKNYCLIRFE